MKEVKKEEYAKENRAGYHKKNNCIKTKIHTKRKQKRENIRIATQNDETDKL